MRRFWKLSVGAMLVAGLFISPTLADNAVARVTKISEKGRLDYVRDGRKFQAYIDMKDFVNDVLITDANTFGSIEFFTGGQIGINKNSQIEITSANQVNTINIKSGGIWSKMATQKQPLQIRTSSGVMGIKGTEFVVTETPEGTELSVLEGQVEATPAEGGAPIQVMPGMTVLLKLKSVEVVTQGEPEALRKSIRESSEWRGFDTALSWAGTISSYSPVPLGSTGSAISTGGYYASRTVDLIDNPAQTLANEAINQVSSRTGFGLPGVSIGGGKKTPDYPHELTPDSQASPGSPQPADALNFSWKGIKKADKYAVLISKDAEANDLVWTGETKEPQITYPKEAAPLTSGTYYWRVIGLNKKGDPVGKASQTTVEVAGQ